MLILKKKLNFDIIQIKLDLFKYDDLQFEWRLFIFKPMNPMMQAVDMTFFNYYIYIYISIMKIINLI